MRQHSFRVAVMCDEAYVGLMTGGAELSIGCSGRGVPAVDSSPSAPPSTPAYNRSTPAGDEGMSYWTQVDLLCLNRVHTFERKKKLTNCQITRMYKGEIYDFITIG